MYSLKFTEADLNANRRGELTEEQRQRLDGDVEQQRHQRKYLIWFFVACIGIALILMVVAEYIDRDVRLLLPKLMETFILLAGFLLAGNYWNVNRLERSKVTFVEGKAHVTNTYTKERKPTSIQRLRLYKGWFPWITLYFPTEESTLDFKQDRRYRVYYVRYTTPSYILSADKFISYCF